MSILIRGMEMPFTCWACEFGHIVNCAQWKNHAEEIVLDKDTKRHPDCPLVPVPPHGDLIERDALMDDIIGSMVFSGRKVPKEAAIVQKVLDIIGDANAIIPAEEGE